jgi:hypothetical protein
VARAVDIVGEMCEVYSQVDSAGIGLVGWEQFLDFLIERGSAGGGGKDTVFSDRFAVRAQFGERSSKSRYEVSQPYEFFQSLLSSVMFSRSSWSLLVLSYHAPPSTSASHRFFSPNANTPFIFIFSFSDNCCHMV